MFSSIINSFLGTGPTTLVQKVLNLELLVYNFHEANRTTALGSAAR